MFKSTKAKSIEEYLALLPDDRREPMKFLHAFIQKMAPGLTPHFAYNMLGYGSFKYKNYKNDTIDWPTVALANQKNYMSLYVCAIDNGTYVAEKYKKELGKVNVGKSCIRFKKIEDLNLKTLETILCFAERFPELTKADTNGKNIIPWHKRHIIYMSSPVSITRRIWFPIPSACDSARILSTLRSCRVLPYDSR